MPMKRPSRNTRKTPSISYGCGLTPSMKSTAKRMLSFQKDLKMSAKTDPGLRKKLTIFQKDLKKQGITMNDYDGDGVPNYKDCQPFNPHKQGKLHELGLKILKFKEERVQKKREKAQSELENLKEKLQRETAAQTAVAKTQNVELKRKQVVVDEINRERKALKTIKEQNKSIKKQLEEGTLKGNIKKFFTLTPEEKENVKRNSKAIAKKSKQVLKKLGKAIGKIDLGV